MKQKLSCILLIDDDEPTNFLHKMVINEANCTEKCTVVHSGQEALNYLKSKELGKYPQPDIIFLDVNMPAMNGWEFLEQYQQLDISQQGKRVMVMLTTSLNPDDKNKADSLNVIDNFMNKPLTVDMVQQIIHTHFSANI